jgi:hypothetical protein
MLDLDYMLFAIENSDYFTLESPKIYAIVCEVDIKRLFGLGLMSISIVIFVSQRLSWDFLAIASFLDDEAIGFSDCLVRLRSQQ